ncbi:MAG: protein kinase [Pirellulaceae bacterium]
MDFGLARENSCDAVLTRSGDILGSPVYMSPEQARGRVSEIGPQSDIYSLGVILYELLCGQRPFSGSVAQVIGRIIYVEPTPPSAHHEGIDEVGSDCGTKAMAKQKKTGSRR